MNYTSQHVVKKDSNGKWTCLDSDCAFQAHVAMKKKLNAGQLCPVFFNETFSILVLQNK